MKKTKISIIIKTLNEEKNIKRAIESAITAIKGLKGEIILADSLSEDNTIEIARQYPIKIVQLKHKEDRSCGVGPQLGYQYSTGEYIYILDGDMELDKDFIKNAITIMENDPKIAGVAGTVSEMTTSNIIFARRKKQMKKKYGETDVLKMGGLYRRKAIESVNYFSNRNLHAFEEAELGYRLVNNNWKLIRINKKAIKHYGYTENAWKSFKKRWKTGYVKGSGEFIRSSIGKPYFIKALLDFKILLATVSIWLVSIIISIYQSLLTGAEFLFGTIVVLLIIMIIRKKSIIDALFSIYSWHYYSAGLILGLVKKHKKNNTNILSKIIKEK